jgi:Tol biopolymer transport system component
MLAIAGALALPALSGAVSPFGKNGRIAYVGNNHIGIMGADGSGQTDLTAAAMANESLPIFSPTGSSILFWRQDGASSDIWGMASDGSGQTNLTETANPITEFASAFFPDGRRVAYSRDDGMQIDIWTMRPDGSNQRQLTTTPDDDEFVADVSADGGRIIFTRQIGGANDTSDVWVMQANGSGQVNLTETASPVAEFFASFSPSGRLIVYDRFSGADRDIWAMRADGTLQHPLAATADQEDNPVVSPDGSLILYGRCIPNCELYTMNLTGGNQTNLTETPMSQEGVPDWESLHKCAGRRATIVGDNGPDRIRGTRRADVILGFGGRDTIIGRGGRDRLCGGKGRDRIRGGKGRDRCKGGPGRDRGVACERGKL